MHIKLIVLSVCKFSTYNGIRCTKSNLYLFFASIAIGLIAIKDVGARHINMLDKLSLNMPNEGLRF